jgi:hypothetical protein
MERFSIHSVDPRLLDLSVWPNVNASGLNPEDRVAFETRCEAIKMLVNGDSRSQIEEDTGVASALSRIEPGMLSRIEPSVR